MTLAERIKLIEESAEPLATMRGLYDEQLADITRHGVSGHDYEKYSTLFSRTIPWERKSPLLKPGKQEANASGTKKRKTNETE